MVVPDLLAECATHGSPIAWDALAAEVSAGGTQHGARNAVGVVLGQQLCHTSAHRITHHDGFVDLAVVQHIDGVVNTALQREAQRWWHRWLLSPGQHLGDVNNGDRKLAARRFVLHGVALRCSHEGSAKRDERCGPPSSPVPLWRQAAVVRQRDLAEASGTGPTSVGGNVGDLDVHVHPELRNVHAALARDLCGDVHDHAAFPGLAHDPSTLSPPGLLGPSIGVSVSLPAPASTVMPELQAGKEEEYCGQRSQQSRGSDFRLDHVFGENWYFYDEREPVTHKVGIIGGDGIGPDVVAEGLKVISAAGVDLETVNYDLGGARYLPRRRGASPMRCWKSGAVSMPSTLVQWAPPTCRPVSSSEVFC
ncbi:3-isopropylmalate dehydrogenase [Nymphon striatum]|nr:3-isopropylmalate dehydrogenase [Nymphon striatum]